MEKTVAQGMVEARKQHPLTVLLVILATILAVSPALEAKLFHPLFVQLGFSILMLVGAWACSILRQEFVGLAVIIALVLVFSWIGYFHPTSGFLRAGHCSRLYPLVEFGVRNIARCQRRLLQGAAIPVCTFGDFRSPVVANVRRQRSRQHQGLLQ